MTRASHHSLPTTPPRRAPPSAIFSPQARVLGVGRRSCAWNPVPQYLEERVLLPKQAARSAFFFTVLSCLLGRTCLPHRGSRLRVGDSTSLSAGFLTATKLRCAQALLGCSCWEERPRWLRLGQPGPGKRGTSGSGGRSPSPSECEPSPGPH